MKTFYVEYTVEVSRLVIVKAEDKDEAEQLVKDGSYLSVEEETEASDIDICSVEEVTEE